MYQIKLILPDNSCKIYEMINGHCNKILVKPNGTRIENKSLHCTMEDGFKSMGHALKDALSSYKQKYPLQLLKEDIFERYKGF